MNLPYESEEKRTFKRLLDYVKDYSRNNQWQIGIAEIALGASIVSYAVHSGQLKIDSEFQAIQAQAYQAGFQGTKFAPEIIGGLAGMGMGGIAGLILGGVGIAAMGGAIGIPAILIAAGGSAIFGLAGYAVTDIAKNFLSPDAAAAFANSGLSPAHFDGSKLLMEGALITAGIWLVIDGAKRVLKDQKVKLVLESVKDNLVVICAGTERIAIMASQSVCDKIKKLPGGFSRFMFMILNVLGLRRISELILARRRVQGAYSAIIPV